MKTKVHRYHPLLVLLNRALALVIMGSLGYRFIVLGSSTNADPAKVGLLRPHMALGMAIGAMTLLRLVVRIVTLPDIVFPPSGAPLSADFNRFTARTVHAVLGFSRLTPVLSVGTYPSRQPQRLTHKPPDDDPAQRGRVRARPSHKVPFVWHSGLARLLAAL